MPGHWNVLISTLFQNPIPFQCSKQTCTVSTLHLATTDSLSSSSSQCHLCHRHLSTRSRIKLQSSMSMCIFSYHHTFTKFPKDRKDYCQAPRDFYEGKRTVEIHQHSQKPKKSSQPDHRNVELKSTKHFPVLTQMGQPQCFSFPLLNISGLKISCFLL